ncbi:ABC transporter permease [Serpentinicella sp. ANB-PHB4]|uniref:ABC transporter permease n=1 Tax=Serpentinicella sp. ANB-PHB4 TaxID=3074076 RepID=UPI00286499DE|nr:ABC transporter permease [Serpentinicella sp. ANB-PHB4]MDR5658360.1 ABC transporter permease [Serpentinicella sp. ANB-PHB4]
MKQTLLIAFKDLKIISKDLKRSFMITLVSILLIITIASGLQVLFKEGIFINKMDVILVNQDTHPLSHFLIDQITEDENVTSILNIIELDDHLEAEESVRKNEVIAGIIIPSGFVNSLEVGTNYPLKLYTNNFNPIYSQMIESMLDSYMKSVSAGQSAVNAVWDYYGKMEIPREQKIRKIDTVVNDITLRAFLTRNNIFYKETIENVNSIDSVRYYFFSILIIMMMLLSIAGLKELVIEKKQMVFQRLRLIGVGEIRYLLGKKLAIIMKVLVQSSLLIILATTYISEGLSTELFLMIILLITMLVTTVSMGLLAAVIINCEERFVGIGNSLVLIMAIVGGGIIPSIYLPQQFNLVSKLMINYWGVEGFIALMTDRTDVFYNIIALLIISSTVFFIGSVILLVSKGGGE